MTDLAGQRHVLELPQLLAGAYIEGARVSGWAERHFAWVGAEDGDVLVDGWGAVPRHLYLDEAVTAKSRGRLARCGIESKEPGPCGEKNARRDALLHQASTRRRARWC